MFSGGNALGAFTDSFEATPGGFPTWLDTDYKPSTDVDMIAQSRYSPDAGYSQGRYGALINSYDLPLAEHQTLNGVGISKPIAQQRGGLSGPRKLSYRIGVPASGTSMKADAIARQLKEAAPRQITRRIRALVT